MKRKIFEFIFNIIIGSAWRLLIVFFILLVILLCVLIFYNGDISAILSF